MLHPIGITRRSCDEIHRLSSRWNSARCFHSHYFIRHLPRSLVVMSRALSFKPDVRAGGVSNIDVGKFLLVSWLGLGCQNPVLIDDKSMLPAHLIFIQRCFADWGRFPPQVGISKRPLNSLSVTVAAGLHAILSSFSLNVITLAEIRMSCVPEIQARTKGEIYVC